MVCEGHHLISPSICCNRIIRETSLLIPRKTVLCPKAMLGEPLFFWHHVPVWMLPKSVLGLGLFGAVSRVLCGKCLIELNLDQ